MPPTVGMDPFALQMALAGYAGQVPFLSSDWLTSTTHAIATPTNPPVLSVHSSPFALSASISSLHASIPSHPISDPSNPGNASASTTAHRSPSALVPWSLWRSFWKSRILASLVKSKGFEPPKVNPVSSFWTSGTSDPEEWAADELKLREIPRFVLDYAPLIHLYSEEQFWPCNIAEHLLHTTPSLNYTPISSYDERYNLTNLDDLNVYRPYVYLESDDNVEDLPEWLIGKNNIPERLEECPVAHGNDPACEDGRFSSKARGGRSDAPAVLVVVNKEDGIVDAFWFFFYSYNLGNKVFNIRFGNHVGDWEHTLVRFKDGEPIELFFSEHNSGDAYSYGAVEKIGKRPIGYSATGTHAMYATSGTHPYVLPWGILHDQTDRGPLWDPLLNSQAYTYDLKTDTIRSSNITPHAPTAWFKFVGHWGDKKYPLSDKRQYMVAGQYHYVTGPLGPRFKSLGRKKVCPGRGACHIKHWRSTVDLPREWVGEGEDEESFWKDDVMGES